MMFRKNGIYRHSNTYDIDMLVRRLVKVESSGTTLDVTWLNRHCNAKIGDEDTIKIVIEQYENWSDVAEEWLNGEDKE